MRGVMKPFYAGSARWKKRDTPGGAFRSPSAILPINDHEVLLLRSNSSSNETAIKMYIDGDNITFGNFLTSSATGSMGQEIVISPNRQYIAALVFNSPYVSWYKLLGETITALPSPAVLPSGITENLVFSPNSKMLIVVGRVTPYIEIYNIVNDTLVKAANPSILPTGTVLGCAFSPDGLKLAVTHKNAPYLTIYSVSGSTLTKLPDPTQLPTLDGNKCCAFSPDGGLLVTGQYLRLTTNVYSVSGYTFTKQPDLQVLPQGTPSAPSINGAAFSSNGKELAFFVYSYVGLPLFQVNGANISQTADGELDTKLATASAGHPTILFSNADKLLIVGQVNMVPCLYDDSNVK